MGTALFAVLNKWREILMKKIFALAIASMLALTMTACGSSDTSSQASDASSDVVAEETTAAASAQKETVAFGDFEGQEALSKKIQNGELTGATVEIEGTSKKLGTHYTIGQQAENNFTGTSYTFDGEYPADGAHVKLVGTVVTEGIVSTIQASSVEVVAE